MGKIERKAGPHPIRASADPSSAEILDPEAVDALVQNDFDVVMPNPHVRREDRQALALRLCDQHAVKWISVMSRQTVYVKSVADLHRQRLNGVRRHLLRYHERRLAAEL